MRIKYCFLNKNLDFCFLFSPQNSGQWHRLAGASACFPKHNKNPIKIWPQWDSCLTWHGGATGSRLWNKANTHSGSSGSSGSSSGIREILIWQQLTTLWSCMQFGSAGHQILKILKIMKILKILKILTIWKILKILNILKILKILKIRKIWKSW